MLIFQTLREGERGRDKVKELCYFKDVQGMKNRTISSGSGPPYWYPFPPLALFCTICL